MPRCTKFSVQQSLHAHNVQMECTPNVHQAVRQDCMVFEFHSAGRKFFGKLQFRRTKSCGFLKLSASTSLLYRNIAQFGNFLHSSALQAYIVYAGCLLHVHHNDELWSLITRADTSISKLLAHVAHARCNSPVTCHRTALRRIRTPIHFKSCTYAAWRMSASLGVCCITQEQ